jgi:outer membrane protein assembly factor BamB
VFASTALLGAQQPPSPSPAPQQASVQKAAVSPDPAKSGSPSLPGTPLAIKEIWSRELPGKTPPILLGQDHLYICNGDQIQCLDLETGKTLWETPSPVGKAWPSNVLGGHLILISEKFEIAALEASNGKLIWKTTVDSVAEGGIGFGSVIVVRSPVSKPVLAGDLILLGTYGMKLFSGRSGKCYALDAKTGKTAWTFVAEFGVEHAPIVENDQVYIGGIGASYALNIKTGAQIWKSETRRDTQFTFAKIEKNLLISSGQYGSKGGWFSGSLYEIDSATGQQKWKFDIGGPSSMAIAAGKAVGIEWGTMGGSRLACVDLEKGVKAWEYKEKSSAWPLIQAGKVVYQTRDNKVHVLELQTGKLTGSFEAPGDFEMGFTSPWSRFLDPFVFGSKAAVASWDKSKKQTVIQTIDLSKGTPADEIRVGGRLMDRPIQVGHYMAAAVGTTSNTVVLKIFKASE